MQAILALHPDREIVLCLAGCRRSRHAILWQRQSAPAGSAVLAGAGFTNAVAPDAASPRGNDTVTCLAGCQGPVGVVVFRGRRFAWIGRDQGETLAGSLAQLGRRLAASLVDEVPTVSRAWLSGTAKAGLMSAFTGEPPGTAAPVKMAAQSPPRG